jgi:hypothetical protein
MPRKRRQSLHFPTVEQDAILDAEIDASIDSGAEPQPQKTPPKTSKKTSFEKIEQDAADKKKNAQVVKEIPQIFTPEQVVWIFDVYVGGVCFVFSILLKTEFKAIYEELKLDDDVKLAWAKPLAKIVSKYAPSEWAAMTAEIELIASVGLWTVAAFQRSKNVAEKEREKKEMEARNPRPRNAVTAVAAHAQ